MNINQYQIGGSLKNDDPNYVERSADRELYESLKLGQFCYVLNARQMGKSSLLVRTKTRLQQEGFSCATLDLTQLGSDNITPAQWYKGIMIDLWRDFNLIDQFNFKNWWQNEADLAPLQQLQHFFETVILTQFKTENIIIFIDEIDSILSLDFSVNDFFALIRFCYNQRAINPQYNRLNFAVFGVANPADLIEDKKRTPFNIGNSIELRGFQLEEIEPLKLGFNHYTQDTDFILKHILAWTNGQPFLTQKLCYLIREFLESNPNICLILTPETLNFTINSLVHSKIIENWEDQDEPEHLITIRNRLLYQEETKGRILGIYQQILKGEYKGGNELLERELFLAGLIVKVEGKYQVKNPIYEAVFSQKWVEQQLYLLRPYSQSFDGWLASKRRDESRLLRGNTLVESQNWARGKSLSDLDYQFLAASEKLDRQEMLQHLEAQRTKEVEARLIQEQKNAKLQKILLGVVTLGLAISSSLGVTAFFQYRQASLNEIRAIAQSSTALFASEERLQALVQAIKAQERAKKFTNLDPTLKEQINIALQKSVYGAIESNRLSNMEGGFHKVTFSSDGKYIATASLDGAVKLWTTQGEEITTLVKYDDRAWDVAFSPDSSLFVASNAQGIITIWQISPPISQNSNRPRIKELKTIKAHQLGIWRLKFSPDGQFLASASFDRTAKIWTKEGILVRTFKQSEVPRALAFSPDGKILAVGDASKNVYLWNLDGTLANTLIAHPSSLHTIAFSPDGSQIVTGDEDGYILIWKADGRLIKTMRGHSTTPFDLVFFPDGQKFVSVSQDNTVKIWHRDGTLLLTLKGHQGEVRGVAISPDGKTIASASIDGNVRLWKPEGIDFLSIIRQGESVTGLEISPNGELLAIGLRDGTIALWDRQGHLLSKIKSHSSQVRGISFNKDGQTMASSSQDTTLKIWDVSQKQLKLLKTVTAHSGATHVVHFSPDGNTIATTGLDGKMRLWDKKGNLLKTISACDISLGMSFSPDGQKIAVGCSGNQATIWNTKGELLQTLKGHKAAVFTVIFSPDGQWIGSISADNTAKLWTKDGTLVKTLTGHKSVLWNGIFSLDSKILVTSSTDQTIKLWRVPEGDLITTLYGHTNSVENLTFSPDGKFLISGSADQNVIIWDLSQVLKPDTVLKYGCNWVRDYLLYNPDLDLNDRFLCEN